MTRLVLGIETSCDDTSVCLLRARENEVPEILSFQYFSSELLLEKWGGIVPEIAARNHMVKLGPLVEACLKESKVKLDEIDLIGVTTHPGLLGPLLTGLNTAKTLALYNKKSIVPVNHLYAHLEAIHLTKEIAYPYLGIVVSGGHTLFLLVSSAIQFEILGTTIDDAAGEAFDKGGKMLGLGYPAGRVIDEKAKQGKIDTKLFPIGLKSQKSADLSYSGVKTAMRVFLEKKPVETLSEAELNNVCASYQYAIVEAINLKSKFAYKMAKEKTGKELPVVIGGGVACNSFLRKVIKESYNEVHFVEPKYCTDNGAMIANYALRTEEELAIPFPLCMEMDAKSRFLSKNELLERARKRAHDEKMKHRKRSLELQGKKSV